VGQARAAAEKARNTLQQHGGGGGNGGGHGRGSSSSSSASAAGPEEGFVTAELAAALTALKAMEVLRPDVGRRLASWVAAAGGGQRAAGEEFGRRQAEVLGELRAQYAAHLRRAVAGVAAAGPSLLGALRSAAMSKPLPPPSASASSAHNQHNRNNQRNVNNGYNGGGDNSNSNSNGNGNGNGGGEYSGEGSERGEGDEAEEAEAASLDELEVVVGPVLAHIEAVVSGLRRHIPQRRALVGVLRGLWDHLGGEALKFVEEDLRQRSSWRLRLMAMGVSERVSAAVSGAIRDVLGHDVKEKDLEPPAPVKKLAEFIGSTATESVAVY